MGIDFEPWAVEPHGKSRRSGLGNSVTKVEFVAADEVVRHVTFRCLGRTNWFDPLEQRADLPPNQLSALCEEALASPHSPSNDTGMLAAGGVMQYRAYVNGSVATC